MSDIIKISELTEKTTLTDNDLFEIVDSVASINKKVKFSTLKKEVVPKRFVATITTGIGVIKEWTVLQNKITIDPEDISVQYIREGNFSITIVNGEFTPGNTAVLIGLGTMPQTDYDVSVRYTIRQDAIDIYTALNGTDTDDLLKNATIIIENYD